MKILITGAKGFIGKNLCMHLRSRGYMDLYEYDIESGREALDRYCADCSFVFHLAGINRPSDPKDFNGNYSFTEELLISLKGYDNKSPILMSSSIQAQLDNPYGQSKKKAEDMLFEYNSETGIDIFVYRLPGVFGKWCRPDYNSVVANFCCSIANGRPVRIDNEEAQVKLVYIDDVIDEFIHTLNSNVNMQDGFCSIKETYNIKVGELKEMITAFHESRKNLSVPDMSDLFTYKLYSTYVSYLPDDDFSYPLTVHSDSRGSFAEFFKSKSGGQVSLNLTKPGITKGNHWHNTKTEKMVVVSGTGVFRLKKATGGRIIEYSVSGDLPTVIDIPAGYIHSVTNTGMTDMVMVIWANEIFDLQRPDTYPEIINT